MAASFASPTVGEFCVSGLLGDALNIPKCFWPPGSASIYQGYFGTGALAGYASASLVAGPSAAPFSTHVFGLGVHEGIYTVNGCCNINGALIVLGGIAFVTSARFECISESVQYTVGEFGVSADDIVLVGENGYYSVGTDLSLDAGTTMSLKAGTISADASNGNLTGTWTYNGAPICAPCPPSDVILKKDIQPLQSSLEKILQLRGVSFKWDEEVWRDKAQENPEGEIGVIAQEVEEIIPEVVREFEISPKYYEEDKEIAGQKIMIKGVKYENLVALLIEGMKEQQQQIQNLEQRIAELEKTN